MGDGFYLRNGIWWIRTDPVTGRRVSTKCEKKADAKRFRDLRQQQASTPAYRAANETRLVVEIDAFLESKAAKKSAGTVHFYTHKLRHVIRIAGQEAVMSDVNPDLVDRIIETMATEGSKSIGKVLTALVQLCKFSSRRKKWVGDTRMLRPTDFDSEYVPRKTALTREQFEKLLSVLSQKRRAHVSLFVGTAGRFGEAHRAQQQDIDLQTWVVNIRGTKTKRSKRTVQIPSPLRPLVAAAFPWLPIQPWKNMVRDLAAACKRAGVPRVTANDLRRTSATWLIEAGVSYRHVADFLGHSSTRMLEEVYGQPRAEATGRLVEQEIENAGTVTKTSPDEYGFAKGGKRDSENPKIVQVAQSVEQWTENPLFLGYAKRQVGNLSCVIGPDSPQSAAKCRGTVTKNVTWKLPSIRARRIALQALNRAFPGCVEAEVALLEGVEAALSGPHEGVLPYLKRAACALGLD